MTMLNNIFLIAAIALCIISLYKNYLAAHNEKIPQPAEKALPDKIYNIILAAVILTALFIRVFRFGSVPGGFNQDGAMASVDAKALADYGTDRYGTRLPVHLTAWGYGQMSALLSYLMVPFIKIGGFNAISLRMPMLVTTLGALVCLYLFIRDVFDKKTALVITAFAAINPWNIIQSRWALDCNLYPQFFMMGIYFLHKGLKKRLHLIISMVMFGLCMYCYGVSIYTLPVFLLAAFIYLMIKKELSVINAVIAFVVYMLIAWPFILTMAINFFRIDTIELPFCTIPFFPDSVRSNDILFFSGDVLKHLSENVKSLLNVTFLQKKDLPWNDIANFGTMYLFSMPFVITGIIALIKEHRKSTGAVLALIFLLTGIWCGLTTNGVNVNRINIIYYPIIIMAGIGICYVIKWISLADWGIAAAYLAVFIIFSTTYFTSYADSMEYYFFKNFGDAVTSLKDSDSDKIYITADSQYRGATAVSEILTLFYHEIDAEYYQGKTKNNDIPFKDKYTFKSIKDIDIIPGENASYVITSDDLIYFEKDSYTFENFGSYYTVTPKK